MECCLTSCLSLEDPACRLPHLSNATWLAWDGAQLRQNPAIHARRIPLAKAKKQMKVTSVVDDDCQITGSRSADERNEAGKRGAHAIDDSDDEEESSTKRHRAAPS